MKHILKLMLLAILYQVSGCTEQNKKKTSNISEPESRSVTILHNMGIVQSGTVQDELFIFKYFGKHKMEVSHFSVNCGCVKPDMKQRVVLPGGQGKVSVRYEVGNQPRDDLQFVSIHFREPGSVPVRLALQASIRSEFSVLERNLTWRVDCSEKPKIQEVLIENHSSEDWSGIKFTCEKEWLNVTLSDIILTKPSHDENLQTWKCSIVPEISKLSLGSHKARVRFNPIEREDLFSILDVELEVVSSLVLLPDSIFATGLSDELSGLVALQLTNRDRSEPIHPGDLVFETECGSDLSVEAVATRDENVLKIAVHYPKSKQFAIDETITCRVAKRKTVIQIPVFIMVRK
jgi:hypothetical protein